MNNKTILITGASAGIGLHSAIGLAKLGAQIVMVGRNEERTQKAVELVRSQTGNESISYLLADLSSLKKIHKLAGEYKERHGKLDVLLNNAGAVFLWRKVSVDGFELTFATNHLNYFLLTHLLLDLLKASPAGRVVNVASNAHYRGHVDLDDLQYSRGYVGLRAYNNSKLMNVLYTYELARRLRGTNVSANCLHPGFISTHIGWNNGWIVRLGMMFLTSRLPVEVGAQCPIYLAYSPDVEGISGKYFHYDMQERRSSEESYDAEKAARLWEISEKMTGIN